MSNSRRLKAAAGAALVFAGLVGVIVVLSISGVISFETALLMLVALLALSVACGVLIAVYRFTGRLQ